MNSSIDWLAHSDKNMAQYFYHPSFGLEGCLSFGYRPDLAFNLFEWLITL